MKSLALAVSLLSTVEAIDNGYGLTPPMGWRSWNCYGAHVNQTLMEQVMDKMVEKTRKTWDNKVTSLADLGYISVGLDDNWQACNKGINGSFHDSEGHPLVNNKTFPSMKGMVKYGHDKSLKVGWYMNNCICREKQFTDKNYIAKHMERSVAAIVEAEFDGVKLDGCGEFRNLTWWAQLLNETKRPVMIENCHWGDTVPGQPFGDGPCSGLTMPSNCPYNFFRSSKDIKPYWESIWFNLQSTRPYLTRLALSRPGSWAYPDMLQVGRLATLSEDRTHFGAWCIVSSPLILGHDVTDEKLNDKIWDIISNTEAIRVNQAWTGHPGRLISEFGGLLGEAVQIWGKTISVSPLEIAVLVMSNSYEVQSAVVGFETVGFPEGAVVSMRDVWTHSDIGNMTGSYPVDGIASHDSRFFTIKQIN